MGSSITVLYVDAPAVLERGADALERAADRVDIVTAATPDAGLTRLADDQIDCVVSAYQLPETDGIEFLEAVRATHPNVPFVLVTNAGSEAIASGAISAGVTEYIATDGEEPDYDTVATRVIEAVGEVRAETTSQRIPGAIESAGSGLCLLAADGTYQFLNDACADIYGYDREELRGERAAAVHPEDVSVTELLERASNDGTQRVEVRAVHADGHTIPTEYTVTPTDRGEFVCTVRDISDRRVREREFAETELRYQTMVEQSQDGVTIVKDNERVFANERFARLLNAKREDIVGVDFAQQYAPESRTLIKQRYQQRLAGKSPPDKYDVNLQTVDGCRRDVEIRTSRIQYDHEPAILVTHRDVTDRRERARELTEQRQKYQTLVEQSHDGIVIVQDKSIEFVNQEFVDLTGYAESELVGRHFYEIIAPEYTDQIEEHYDQRMDGKEPSSRYDIDIIRQDGERRHIDLEVSRIQYRGKSATFATFTDITERKNYEERLESQRDNLETLNQVLRHDIRNDLQLVQTYTELLGTELDEEDGQSDYLESLQESATHAVELTRTARDLAETMLATDESHSRVPLRETLETELERVRSETAAVEIDVDRPLPAVTVNANEMLDSIFRNLLTNAVQHSNKETPAVRVSASASDETVRVRVADDGPGVPDSQKDNIFSKGETGLDDKGTGIGLFLVGTLVESYDGEVWVEDNEPTGAAFVVQLPLAEEETAR